MVLPEIYLNSGPVNLPHLTRIDSSLQNQLPHPKKHTFPGRAPTRLPIAGNLTLLWQAYQCCQPSSRSLAHRFWPFLSSSMAVIHCAVVATILESSLMKPPPNAANRTLLAALVLDSSWLFSGPLETKSRNLGVDSARPFTNEQEPRAK